MFKFRLNLRDVVKTVAVLTTFSANNVLAQDGGIFVTLGSPINQKLEQKGINYDVGGYSPNIDLTASWFGEDSDFFGWGASIAVSVLDIKNLPETLENKKRRAFWGLYTGPAFRLMVLEDYPLINLIANAQIGYAITNFAPILEGMSWGGFSIKTSVDIILFNKFSIGVAYRPLDLLITDEYVGTDKKRMVSYTSLPVLEARISLFFYLDASGL